MELFSFSGTINSVPMVFNFTHPVHNSTMLHFADMALVIEQGATNWLFAIDGGWPFTSRATEFSLAVSLALDSWPVNLIERINNKPRVGRTTYSINSGQQNGEGDRLDLRFVVFDVAVADEEIVAITHSVTLNSDANGRQMAMFHFAFPAFQYSFHYDPELVLIVADSSDSSPAALIAGILALLVISGMVLLAIARAGVGHSRADTYRGTDHLPLPSEDTADHFVEEEEIYPHEDENRHHLHTGKTPHLRTDADYAEAEYHDGNNGANDIEMEVLDAHGRKKSESIGGGRHQARGAKRVQLTGGRPRPSTRRTAATEYPWEVENDEGYATSHAG